MLNRLRIILGRIRQRIWPGLVALCLTGGRVRSGIFAGLRYRLSAHGSCLAPKLLGSYEQEVQQWLAENACSSYEHIVVIGAAEGFYAVGLAKLFPAATVTAHEMDPDARQALKRLAARNDVARRISVRGKGDRFTLAEELKTVTGRALVVVDIEGAEYELLGKEAIPGLERADLVVEVHRREGESEQDLFDKLARTHSVTRLQYGTRHLSPKNRAFHPLQKWLQNEHRSTGLRWLACKANQAAPGTRKGLQSVIV